MALAATLLVAACANSGSSPPQPGTDAGNPPGQDRPQDLGTGGTGQPDVPGVTTPDGGGGGDDGGAPGGMTIDPRKTLGVSCAVNDDCRSGFCVDGVCCDGACGGACLSCAISGSVGHCMPAEIGTDPRNQCPDQGLASCGTDGVCDGAGACRKYPSGVTCKGSTCNGANMDLASRCDGNGACVPTATQSCAPFMCDSVANACRSTCMMDADCAAPSTCMNGSCGKKPLGAACATGDQCNSGFCAQGTCCSSACDGTCRSCGQPGTAGNCVTVPAGQDPFDQCAQSDAKTCGTDGTCDGNGACRKFLSGTVCSPAMCNGGTESSTRRCDGNGVCQTGTTRTCEPFACGNGGTCLSACTTGADCAADFFCIGGSCTKKGAGAACAADTDCASGSCQQGVCCNRACTGGCVACNLVGFVGVCTPVPAGQDPMDGCADTGAPGCGADGLCDGNGSCRLYANGTICGGGSCSGNTQTLASRCNGAGACVTGSNQDCTPYVCAPGGACLGTCGGNNDCTTGNVCTNASCGKKPNGAACGTGPECVSGICAQGVCCGSACSGLCQSCNVAGSVGTCSPVADGDTDPQNRCTDGGAAACGADGKCNGKSACRVYNSSTQCAAQTCVGSTLTLARSCDGNGVCVAATTRDCNEFQCDPVTKACRTSCGADTDCTAPNVCIGGVCRKKDLAAGCTTNAECASGFCQQGVCCASLCNGTCRSCALAGSAGACTNIPAHADSQGTCPDDGQTTCKRDGKCDGNGNCEQYAAGLTCAAPSCANATAVGASTCNGTGACVTGASTSCKPYACDTNGACKTTCAANGDCTSPSFCQAPTCNGGKANGSPCAGSTDCQSTFCSPQGVCCDSACTGTCVSCNQAGSSGTCKNIPAGQLPFVASQCMNQGAASCGTDGTCDGNAGCRFYPGGTTCVAAMCSAGTFTPPQTCSAAHACQTVTATNCGNFACNGSGCLATCASDNDCVAPSKCLAGQCGGLKGQYFKNMTWTGTPANIRVDGPIDFPMVINGQQVFGNGSPFPGDVTWPIDHWSVIWTGTLTPRFTGSYIFQTLSDDGVKLTVNGTVLYDDSGVSAGNQLYTSAPIMLTANTPVPIRIDYFDNIMYAQLHLYWANAMETGGTTCPTVAMPYTVSPTCPLVPTTRLTPDP